MGKLKVFEHSTCFTSTVHSHNLLAFYITMLTSIHIYFVFKEYKAQLQGDVIRKN